MYRVLPRIQFAMDPLGQQTYTVVIFSLPENVTEIDTLAVRITSLWVVGQWDKYWYSGEGQTEVSETSLHLAKIINKKQYYFLGVVISVTI